MLRACYKSVVNANRVFGTLRGGLSAPPLPLEAPDNGDWHTDGYESIMVSPLFPSLEQGISRTVLTPEWIKHRAISCEHPRPGHIELVAQEKQHLQRDCLTGLISSHGLAGQAKKSGKLPLCEARR